MNPEETDNDGVRCLRDILQADLDALLAELESGQLDGATRVLDILTAYRLLLGRPCEDPAPAQLAARAREFPSVDDVRNGFLSSNEFHRLYHGNTSRSDGRIVLARDGELRVAVHMFDRSIGWAIINGVHEPAVRWAIERLVQPGWHCADLGANAGFFTGHMALAAGPSGFVHAYEPYPLVQRMLEITLAESGVAERVRVRNVACGAERGHFTLCFSTETDHLGGQFVIEEGAAVPPGFESARVDAVVLDEDLEGQRPVQFVKMDIEGAEVRALHGMSGILGTQRPVIVMELNAANLARHGAVPMDAVNYLTAAGYRVAALEPLHESGEIVWIPEADPSVCENVLCVPKETAEATVGRLVSV